MKGFGAILALMASGMESLHGSMRTLDLREAAPPTIAPLDYRRNFGFSLRKKPRPRKMVRRVMWQREWA